jgi:ATP-dependent helicase HrpB
MPQPLPIDELLPPLRAALSEAHCAVVQAPPGAGKTTRVPLALLHEPWLRGRRIVMLEPRRLAARAAAAFMAKLLGEPVGRTVGYRVRLDTRVSAHTRIEVVTEGVLTRMLQADPSLDGVGVVIFDEFHERSLHADLGLALTLQARSLLREELRVLVMSATLDAAPVAALLGEAPVLTSAGRSYSVDLLYRATPVEGWIEPAATRTIRRALDETAGDILVFLPGAAEIRRVQQALTEEPLPRDVTVFALHGRLPADAQDAAIAPSPPGMRKVVLATSIAETSLTIEGVRVVIDAGLMRVPRFSPRTGLTRLETVAVTRDSAEQRCGRAGRLGPGVCYRMWTEGEHAARLARRTPEILEADLAPLALELAAWGVADPAELAWLDPPPAAALAQADELLRALEALDQNHRITPHGRRMAALALHPRLAHMLLRARALRLASLAADLAALLAERDIARGDAPADPDIALRLHALRALRAGGRSPGAHIDRGAAHRALEESRHWRRRLGVDEGDREDDASSHGIAPDAAGSSRRGAGEDPAARGEIDASAHGIAPDAAGSSRRGAGERAPRDNESAAGLLLAFAYPDRIAAARAGARGRFLLRNGRGGSMDRASALAACAFVVAAEIEGHGRDSRIHLAGALAREDLERHFADAFEHEDAIAWDGGTRSVRALRRTRLGAIVLSESRLATPDPDRVADVLCEEVVRGGFTLLPWAKETTQLRERLAFLHRVQPSWPDVSDDALAADAASWLRPFLGGASSADHLRRIDVGGALLSRVPWELRRLLDTVAPTHFQVPSGSRIPIDYSDPDAPALAVRLQEVFGLAETPRIAGGAVPITMRLLSPAHRPVQVTRDLASFWRDAYFEVRKDLRGRYPRHHWPENPLEAEATRRAKPRLRD